MFFESDKFECLVSFIVVVSFSFISAMAVYYHRKYDEITSNPSVFCSELSRYGKELDQKIIDAVRVNR